MSQIPVQKTVFNKDTYGRVIDTQFSQLLNQTVEETYTFTVDDFFQLYDYNIPFLFSCYIPPTNLIGLI